MSAGIWHQATDRHMTPSYFEVTTNQPWSLSADAEQAAASAVVEKKTKLNGDGTTEVADPLVFTAAVNSVATNTVNFTIDAPLANRGDWYEIAVQITGTSGAVWTELLGVKVVG